MNEIYEQHLIKQVKRHEKMLIYLRNLCFLTFILYGILMSFGVCFIFLGLWLLFLIVCRNVFVDYDYEYCCGELVISQVILKKKRKTIATLKTSQFIKKCKSQECAKSVRATIDRNETTTYVFQTSIGEVGFVMSLNEKMEKLIMKGV